MRQERNAKSSRLEVFCKKGVLRNFAKFLRVSFLIKLQASTSNFVKKEILAQVFSCEFCEISKTTFLQNTSGRLLLECYASLNFHRWLHLSIFPSPSQSRTKRKKLTFTLLWGASKGFMKALKAFTKHFEAPQRCVKIEI